MKNNKHSYKFNIFFLFIFFSFLTTVAHFSNLNMAKWIDIPTHFIGGMAMATLLPKEKFKNKPLFSLSIITTIGFGWEFTEIMMANKEVFTVLFQETKIDKIGDLIFGLLGFIFVYIKKY